METEQRLEAKKGRTSLPPDKYDAAFLIAYITKYTRLQLRREKSGDRLIADQYVADDGNRYCCPKLTQQFAKDIRWIRIGRYHSRNIWQMERYKQVHFEAEAAHEETV